MKIKELLYDTYFGGCGCDCGRPTYYMVCMYDSLFWWTPKKGPQGLWRSFETTKLLRVSLVSFSYSSRCSTILKQSLGS